MSIRTVEKKYLGASGLLKKVRTVFEKIDEPLRGAQGKDATISLCDCLMSGLALFGLKHPSLLQFDQKRHDPIVSHNLKQLYQVDRAPCDTYLRERLDPIEPAQLRKAFTTLFSTLQRGKVFESYAFLDGHYLISLDGTGYFSSKDVHCDNCCEKNHRNGSKTYYHQMLGAVMMHPEHREVFPLCPEPIFKRDGENKNDCERQASFRFLEAFRREHPHLRAIIIEDALAANAPHIQALKEKDLRFIITVKPDGNKSLFEWMLGLELNQLRKTTSDGRTHQFRWFNEVPLNASHPEIEVHFLKYEVFNPKGRRIYHNTWITDIPITQENVDSLARGGRARWKIENETFNTLKNQGYHFEHNFGHGTQNLSTVLAFLMMLAFLIDQAQQRCCGLFQAALAKEKSKTNLWFKMRSLFTLYTIESWSVLFQGMVFGIKDTTLIPNTS